jgi:rfaE bifunctional protein nucleotidyltransferase chain/domain
LSKVKTLAQLRPLIASAKVNGQTVVLANGCFDLFHVGHIRYLREAKEKGDILIVALNSDASVRRLKGPRRPIIPQAERAEILSAFWFVDYVVIFGESNVERILRALQPHFHVKGSDYTINTVPEREAVKAYGGRIAIVGGPKIKNTSDIIRRISAQKNG